MECNCLSCQSILAVDDGVHGNLEPTGFIRKVACGNQALQYFFMIDRFFYIIVYAESLIGKPDFTGPAFVTLDGSEGFGSVKPVF